MSEQVGDRVQHVREYYGWTQAELAAASGVTQSAISQIERGAPATIETITDLARASQFPVQFFLRGALPELPQGSIKYRKTSKATVREDKRIRSHVRHTMEALEVLSRIAKPPPVRLAAVDPGDEVDDDFIEELAGEAREWMGVGPLDPIPNMMRAVERAGVVIIRSGDEVGGHTGVSFWPECPFGTPIIWITRNVPGDRGRMTIGHEVGHLLLHTLRRVSDAKKAEAEAYRFGGALLIPREAVEEIRTPITLGNLAQAKARWGLAISALVLRCKDVGVIDNTRATSLFKQIGSRGWRKDEPVEVPVEHPVLLHRLMEAALGTANPFQASRQVGLAPTATRDLVA